MRVNVYNSCHVLARVHTAGRHNSVLTCTHVLPPTRSMRVNAHNSCHVLARVHTAGRVISVLTCTHLLPWTGRWRPGVRRWRGRGGRRQVAWGKRAQGLANPSGSGLGSGHFALPGWIGSGHFVLTCGASLLVGVLGAGFRGEVAATAALAAVLQLGAAHGTRPVEHLWQEHSCRELGLWGPYMHLTHSTHGMEMTPRETGKSTKARAQSRSQVLLGVTPRLWCDFAFKSCPGLPRTGASLQNTATKPASTYPAQELYRQKTATKPAPAYPARVLRCRTLRQNLPRRTPHRSSIAKKLRQNLPRPTPHGCSVAEDCDKTPQILLKLERGVC